MTTERCALCGTAIVGDPVVRVVGGRQSHFDTEDCARVYEAADAAGMLDAILSDAPPTQRGAGGPRETAYFTVDGMWCPMCASATERALQHAAGVRGADVTFALGRGRVEFDPTRVSPDELLHRVQRLGYRATLSSDGRSRAEDRHEEGLLIQVLVALAFGMQVMVLYLVRLYGLYETGQAAAPDARTLGLLVWALSTPVLLYSGQTFLRGAWNGILARTANMDTLVALGTLSAYAYSAFAVLTSRPTYFDSVTMIIQFVMIGRYLEAIGGARARKDVRALLELQPERAWRLDAAGAPAEVRSAELARGDRIVVRTGERVPADAEVLDGGGAADESMLTGESTLATKRTGDTLWAGTLLAEGPVTARVERAVDETRLASIRSLVVRTLSQKAPVERLADTASAWLTLAILAAAVATFAGWMLLGAGAPRSLLAAVAVLVVACPCALGLATPLAISVALGRATRAGVLVRVPAALETATTVGRVAFDKTGTLTAGRLELVDIRSLPDSGVTDEEIACLVAGAERYSEHPLGRTLATACASPDAVTGVRTVRGMGVQGTTPDGREVRVGAERFMPGPVPADMAGTGGSPAMDGSGAAVAETRVWVSLAGRVAGVAVLRDTVAEGATSALAELRVQGRTTVLLSGDSAGTTATVARALGLTEHRGRLTPEEKAEAIASWQAAGERVAMVGDGINDAPALAQADIAMTVAGGTDVAGETSDVVLARRDLRLVPYFLRLSHATRRITRENLAWALAYNAVAVPLAATGRISPAIAAAAMAVSSLIVVGNSLRLGAVLRPGPHELPEAGPVAHGAPHAPVAGSETGAIADAASSR